MKLPMQITFRQIEASPEDEALVRQKAAKLDRFAQDVMGCRVVVNLAGRHRRHGNQFDVRIDLTLAGEEIAVTSSPGEHEEYRDLGVALRDAFDAAARRLEDYVRRRRTDVKTHTPMPSARVMKLFPDEGYGFLETHDQREVYFSQASVVDRRFDEMQIGDDVTFVEQPGDKGPQASTVTPIGTQHHQKKAK
jgi:cold shock CspA family protein